MPVTTGSMNTTLYFEDGKEVFHCVYGHVHRGDWAPEARNHCNCEHRDLLMIGGIQPLICGECGTTRDFEEISGR